MCTSQMVDLMNGMGPAIQSVHILMLRFQHRQIRSSRRGAKAASTSNNNSNGPSTAAACPASFAAVSRTVCTLLATALPCLVHLSLQGCCWDPAFAAFGASCPGIKILQIEAVSLPIKALDDITAHMPHLQKFALTSPTPCPGSSQLAEYVEASLLALQPSTLLSAFGLSFEHDVVLECKPGGWLHVPPNLHTFHCMCQVSGIHHATALLSAVRDVFVIQTLRFEELLQMLSLAPHLRKLYVIGQPGFDLWCDNEGVPAGLLLLRERVLAGLQLRFSSVHFVESAADLAAVLTALPALEHVTGSCVLQFATDPKPHCLAEVARVFPGLDDLTLLGSTPVVSPKALEPLAACTSLKILEIHMPMSHTTTDLLQLCLDIPSLKVLRIRESAAIDLPLLLFALDTQGREVDIQGTAL